MEEKHAILTIGANHYVMPITAYHHNRGDDIVSMTLQDETKLKISTNNAIIVTGESDFISAILETSEEKFYQPEQTKHGKIMLKRITKDVPFKPFGGNQNE